MTCIELTDCRLRSDQYNWIIELKRVGTSGDKKGVTYYTPETYHPNIKQAARHLLERTLRASEVTELHELIEICERIEKDGVRIVE